MPTWGVLGREHELAELDRLWADTVAGAGRLVVLDGEEVAGVSFNTVSPEEIARQGINQGWVAELGVRRPWRKRGVATALLCESMRAFKRAGLDFATLGVDTENPTGALRLYESVGFRPVRRFIVFSKPVP